MIPSNTFINNLLGVCLCTFPGAAVMLAELAVEAGLPNNVLNPAALAYGQHYF